MDENTPDQSKSVLIVEDDKFLRDMLVNKFEEAGFQVNAAVTGGDAFKMLAVRKPDLITLDLIIPDMDGFRVLAKIKADPQTLNIPILILSNLMEKEGIDRAMSLGAAAYLVKANSTPDEIVERVKTLIGENK